MVPRVVRNPGLLGESIVRHMLVIGPLAVIAGAVLVAESYLAVGAVMLLGGLLTCASVARLLTRPPGS